MPCYFRDMELLTVIHHAYRRRRIMSTTPLNGPVHTWALRQSARSYLTVTLTFGEARRLYKSEPYEARTGRGEQRAVIDSHVRLISKAMDKGEFTPTAVHVGVRP